MKTSALKNLKNNSWLAKKNKRLDHESCRFLLLHVNLKYNIVTMIKPAFSQPRCMILYIVIAIHFSRRWCFVTQTLVWQIGVVVLRFPHILYATRLPWPKIEGLFLELKTAVLIRDGYRIFSRGTLNAWLWKFTQNKCQNVQLFNLSTAVNFATFSYRCSSPNPQHS